ncbi:hypothetical protein VTJ83DRAFT_1381 [Remersonia thermophila]|uniref:Rhodopsin domain-containing protein n=1 Tax=Remersonia thermophila TaxID=72144 RepID=A0ABR4DPL0_9PEZI
MGQWVDHVTPEIDRKSDWRMIMAICISLSVVSSAVVLTRVWIRNKNHGMAADDWMSILSMIFCDAYAALCIAQTKYGLGLPLADRPKQAVIAYTRSNYAGRPIYQVGISFFKVALLISYLRLFKGTSYVVYRRIVWISMVLIVAGHVGCALTLILACQPVHKSWNPSVPGKCLAPGPSFTAYAIVTIVSDVAVAVIPIPALLKLKVSKSRKIGLIVIFLLGLFTTLCSVFRYQQIDRIQYGDGNTTMLILWGVIEFCVGNMVSSLPFLAPVFLRKAREYTGKYGSGSDSRNYASGGRSVGSRLGAMVSDKLRSSKSGSRLDSLTSGNHDGAYKLSSVASSPRRGAYATAIPPTGSEENILKQSPENSIMKSVTYSVRVD